MSETEHDRVDVTATATAIATGKASRGNSVIIRNPSGNGTIDLGGSDVTDGTGFELAAGESITVPLALDETVYGIAAAAQTETVHVLRTGMV